MLKLILTILNLEPTDFNETVINLYTQFIFKS